MLLTLVGLCLAFSFATLTEQQPNPTHAAAGMLKQLQQLSTRSVLIVSSESREDQDFAYALETMLSDLEKTDPTWSVDSITGTPQQARQAIEGNPSGSLIILQSPGTDGWKLFEGLEGKFPDKKLTILACQPVLWPSFLNSQNLINIVNQIVIIAILAIGMTLVILLGGIDLSVGSLIALSAVLCTVAIRDFGGGELARADSIVLCSVLALLVCAAAGVVNGLLIVRFQIPPFIATLGMMLIASGSAFLLSKGQSIASLPDSFVWLGRGTWLGIPVAVLLMVGLYAIAHGVMSYTVYGRRIYAIGGNVEAARLCGIQVPSLIVSTYLLSAVLAGLGGLVMASRLKSGDPNYGAMYELYVIAAVVVGGTSLRGGYGSILGTLVGALIIAVIENGMNLMQIGSYMQKVIFGLVILGAVLIDRRTANQAI